MNDNEYVLRHPPRFWAAQWDGISPNPLRGIVPDDAWPQFWKEPERVWGKWGQNWCLTFVSDPETHSHDFLYPGNWMVLEQERGSYPFAVDDETFHRYYLTANQPVPATAGTSDATEAGMK